MSTEITSATLRKYISTLSFSTIVRLLEILKKSLLSYVVDTMYPVVWVMREIDTYMSGEV